MRTTARLSLCLLGCLVLSPGLEGAKDCPKDWLRYQGSCYGFFPKKITWAEAERECQKQGHGAHLASILSSAATEVVAGYISSHYPNGNVWIGLHDPNYNRVWTWTDGSSFTYRAWRFWEPNNWMWREYCVELRYFSKFKKWNDIYCNRKRAFICKYHLKAERAPALGR